MSERVSPEVATELVGNLIGLYPPGLAKGSKAYIGGLVAVLQLYPKAVVERIADPLRGVARESEYLPSPALVIEWCERETAGWRRVVEAGERQAANARAILEERAAGDRLELERRSRPTVEELKRDYGATFGLDADDPETRRRRAVGERIDRANKVLWARECRAAGIPKDSPVSPSLLRLLGRRESAKNELGGSQNDSDDAGQGSEP
jgi:hypothetical protein